MKEPGAGRLRHWGVARGAGPGLGPKDTMLGESQNQRWKLQGIRGGGQWTRVSEALGGLMAVWVGEQPLGQVDSLTGRWVVPWCVVGLAHPRVS